MFCANMEPVRRVTRMEQSVELPPLATRLMQRMGTQKSGPAPLSSFILWGGRPKATISWEFHVIERWCRHTVNGQECPHRTVIVCDDGYLGFFLDCENVLTTTSRDDGGPVLYSSCHPQTGGVLDVFAWVDSDSFLGCPFRTMEKSIS